MVTNCWQFCCPTGTAYASKGSQGRGRGSNAATHTKRPDVARALGERMVSGCAVCLALRPDRSFRPAVFTALATLFQEPQYLTKKDEVDDPDAGLTAIDFEEQTAGYQAAYSRLAASESVTVDPVAYVRDPREFLGQEMVKLSRQDPRIKTLVAAADATVARPFLASLAGSGYVI